jgi:hypothetical protein
MTTSHPLTRAALCLTFAACAVPVFAADATGPETQPGACASRPYSEMHERILDRAAQGPDALRRYVGIIQPLHQIDFADAVAWLDHERERLETCRMASLRGMTARR